MNDIKSIIKAQELVINWHLTEACNYGCRYCYAKWTECKQSHELIHDPQACHAMLVELYKLFNPQNYKSPLAREMRWRNVRLNLAGGEPLLYKNELLAVLKQAYKMGFAVSIITNASQLDRATLFEVAPYLSWLGISLDSHIRSTNLAIGRNGNDSNTLNVGRLAQDIQSVRRDFPLLRIKINTVVNALNHHEFIGDLISQFSPHKWKVLRMLPILDRSLVVTREQFEAYLARHAAFSSVLSPEDNDEMTESYLMINPRGLFYQNQQGSIEDAYTYSSRILDVGAEAAFSEMKFDIERFASRYTRALDRASA